MKKGKKGFWHYLPMDTGRFIYWLMHGHYRFKKIGTDGKRYKNPKGGAIIVSFHKGFSDPFILGSMFCKRRLYFLTAKEVMFNKIVETLLKGMGCIKIDREASDIAAIKQSVEVLKNGNLLGMFPEGGIHRDGKGDKIKGGAVLIALRAGVPIIPVYTEKRSNIFKRKLVIVGKDFNCSDYCAKKFPSVADLNLAAEELYEKMEECKKIYEQYVK